MAGTLPFGLIFRNSGVNCSPLRVSIFTGSKASPDSYRNSATLVGFGDPLK